MAATTSIAWTERTWNPIVGCSIVSPGCHHCYAQTMAKRLKAMALADIDAGKNPGRKRHYISAINEHGRWSGNMVPVPEALGDPLKWKKPAMIFVNSMSDLFHERVPDEFIDRVFAVMALAPYHVFQVLTKRADRMAAYMQWKGHSDEHARRGENCPCRQCRIVRVMAEIMHSSGVGEWTAHIGCAGYVAENWPLPNVWLGCSVEDQKRADERIPHLLKTPAAVRFLSVEPLLGPVDLSPWLFSSDGFVSSPDGPVHRDDGGTSIDWLIIGGESGPGARHCHMNWIRSIVGQCQAAGTPAFVKQIGSRPIEDEPDDGPEWPVPLVYGHSGFIEPEIRDSKGGDMDEWPDDLRVRQFPTTTGASR